MAPPSTPKHPMTPTSSKIEVHQGALSAIFASPAGGANQDLLIASFRRTGLLVYDHSSKRLSLLTPLATGNGLNGGSGPLWSIVTTIHSVPAPPNSLEPAQIVLNENGSKVILVGKKLALMVSMPEDTWRCRSLHSESVTSAWVDRLQPTYNASSSVVHMALSMGGRHPPSITKARWMTTGGGGYMGVEERTKRRGLFALLHSDNVVRVYGSRDGDEGLERPTVALDFNTALTGGNRETAREFLQGSAIGMVKRLVSFDFGPRSAATGLDTIVAIDSNGDLYSAAFSLDGSEILFPAGPLDLINASKASQVMDRFTCSAADLLFVNDASGDGGELEDSNVPILAAASTEGLVANLVLVERENAGKSCPLFDVFLHDSIQLGLPPGTGLSQLRLSLISPSDPLTAAYILYTDSTVYHVDLGAWREEMHSQLEDLSPGMPTSSPAAKVTPILTYVDGGAKTASSSIRSLALIELAGEEELSRAGLVAQLLVTNTARGEFHSARMSRRTASTHSDHIVQVGKNKAAGVRGEPTLAEELAALMGSACSLPSIQFSEDVKMEDALMLATKIVQEAMIGGLTSRDSAIDFAAKRSLSLIDSFAAIHKSREECAQRMAATFAQITRLKSDAAKQRRRYELLEQRVSRLAPKFQLGAERSNDGKEFVGALKGMNSRLRGVRDEVAKLNLEVEKRRRELLGPVKSFQPTANAVQWMLTKKYVCPCSVELRILQSGRMDGWNGSFSDYELAQMKRCVEAMTGALQR